MAVALEVALSIDLEKGHLARVSWANWGKSDDGSKSAGYARVERPVR